jgi:hypothetical protein
MCDQENHEHQYEGKGGWWLKLSIAQIISLQRILTKRCLREIRYVRINQLGFSIPEVNSDSCIISAATKMSVRNFELWATGD